MLYIPEVLRHTRMLGLQPGSTRKDIQHLPRFSFASPNADYVACTCISQKRSGIRGCQDFNLGEPEGIYNICIDFHLRLKMLIVLNIPETLRPTFI